MHSKQAGFSLIDVLVAIAVFAILMAAISSIIVRSFGASAQNDARTQKTIEVQQVAENLRRHWSDPTPLSGTGTVGQDRISRACYGTGFVIPTGFTVAVRDVTLNSDGTVNVSPPYSLSSDCASAAQRPTGSESSRSVRRVTIQSDVLRGQSAELTFEM